MALIVKDGANATMYLDGNGAGTVGDPIVMGRVLRAGNATIGKLAANAGVIIGDVNSRIVAELPAGTQAIGKLAANPGVDIGNIGAVANVVTIAGLGKGQGTMANSLPVVVSSNHSTIAVKGTAISVPLTLTVTNGEYSAGDSVGGVLTFANAVSANGKRSRVNSLKLSHPTSAISYNLLLFTANIVAAAADNDPVGLNIDDFPKFLGTIPIVANDYIDEVNGFHLATVRNIGLQIQAAATVTTIYGYLVSVGITSPGTTNLYLTLDLEFLD